MAKTAAPKAAAPKAAAPKAAARSATPTPPTPERTVIPIRGMTCKACETRIAKSLKKLPGVQSVRASTRLGQAEVTHVKPLNQAEVKEAVTRAGYELGREKRAWLSNDREAWRDVMLAAAVVIVVAIALKAAGAGSIGDVIGSRAEGNVALFLLLGVAASLSSCMALVGGLVLGVSARFAETHPDATPLQRLRPQFLFNAARLVTFTALGAVLGRLGQALGLSGHALGLLTLAVAVIMGLLGVKLTGLSPKLGALTITLPAALTARLHTGDPASASGPAQGEGTGQDAQPSAGQTTRPYRDLNALALGAASFFLPCGFTQAAQVAAAASGSPAQGALILGLFTLGTTPGLLTVGALSSLIKGKTAARFFRWTGVVVIAFAVVNVINAYHILAPAGVDEETPITATARTDNVTDAVGYQLVTITVDARGYTPQETVVYAGVPIRWQFDLNGLTCAATVNGNNLGFGTQGLDQGLNVFESTLPAAGRYPYSCYMGMYASSVIAIDPPS
jgi:sulfite exporter TauE/SafE/copper chaperone CopZ